MSVSSMAGRPSGDHDLYASPDKLSLTIGTVMLQGWTAIRVTRAIERFPSDFEIELAPVPSDLNVAMLTPGQACSVMLGADLVLTGWIDRAAFSLTATSHVLQVAGRGRCSDLFDCSVDTPGCGFNRITVAALATRVAAPYGITVVANAGAGPTITLNYFVTQTPYELIGQAARFAQFIVYDAPDGSLVLDTVGSAHMAGGITHDIMEEGTATFDISDRFSEYRCYSNSVDYLQQVYGTGSDPNLVVPPAREPAGTIRHRVLSFVAEQGANYATLAEKQAQWEMNRRVGRSQVVRVTVSTWRDQDGALWEPNRRVIVDLPGLSVVNADWLISEVAYRKDMQGTHADLTLMPPAAFAPQPSNLYQFDPNVLKTLQAAGAAPT